MSTSVRHRLATVTAGLALFGMACSSPARPAAAASAAPPTDAPRDAVRVAFETRSHEPWSLRQANGTFVCALPCAYWVAPESGLRLQNDASAHQGDEPQLVAPHLPSPPGGQLVARVDRTHADGGVGRAIAGASAGVFGMFGGTITALSIGGLATGSKGSTMNTSVCVSASGESVSGSGVNLTGSACAQNGARGTAADLGGLALGTAMLGISALSTYWLFHAHSGGIDYHSAPAPRSATRLHLRPGFVEVERGAKHARLTLGGAQGVF